MSKNEVVKAAPIQLLQDPELLQLANTISGIVTKTKQGIAASVNTAIVEAYWTIGKHIVEFEQQGEVRAKYGTGLLKQLGKILSIQIGKGFGHSNLYAMRKFYVYYPKFQTVSGKLSWSHICELLKVDDELERNFYERIAFRCFRLPLPYFRRLLQYAYWHMKVRRDTQRRLMRG